VKQGPVPIFEAQFLNSGVRIPGILMKDIPGILMKDEERFSARCVDRLCLVSG
jgi:hypothetical protein